MNCNDSEIDRYSILNKDSDFVFDFKTAPFPLANRKFWPALEGTGLAFAPAVFPGNYLNTQRRSRVTLHHCYNLCSHGLTLRTACSIAALHIHPRAAELFYVVSGKVQTRMVPESGVVVVPTTNKPRVIKNTLSAKQTTIFPQGAFHMQMNAECEDADVVVAFSSDDPGASLILPGAFELDDELLLKSLGGALNKGDLKRIRAVLPQGALFEVEECKKRCAK